MTKKIIVLAFVLAVASLGAASARAATLSGWAWSDGFGWISFNSGDSGAGGGPYSVAVDSSGNWSGYAWSQYLGWISFNQTDTSSCGAQAHLNTANGAVTGWGKALIYSGNEGCIELSGTNHTSPLLNGTGGVTYNSSTGQFLGYAWGGDTSAKTGPGWIQFNTPTPVVCKAADCGYSANITGTCTGVTAYQNVPPGTSVTFQANPTSGTSPYQYQWNPPSVYNPPNQYTATYSSTSAGPTVIIKDSNGLVTQSVSCPTVTVLNPIGSSNISIGRTVASANTTSFTAKQGTPFAIKWNFTVTNTYSCVSSVSPDPSNPNWNSSWKGTLTGTNNGDGTATYSGNTGTTLTAGTASNPVTPGMYQFAITCSGTGLPTQSTSATLKVNSSSVNEI